MRAEGGLRGDGAPEGGGATGRAGGEGARGASVWFFRGFSRFRVGFARFSEVFDGFLISFAHFRMG